MRLSPMQRGTVDKFKMSVRYQGSAQRFRALLHEACEFATIDTDKLHWGCDLEKTDDFELFVLDEVLEEIERGGAAPIAMLWRLKWKKGVLENLHQKAYVDAREDSSGRTRVDFYAEEQEWFPPRGPISPYLQRLACDIVALTPHAFTLLDVPGELPCELVELGFSTSDIASAQSESQEYQKPSTGRPPTASSESERNKPWMHIRDYSWHRHAVELWWKGLTIPEIAARVYVEEKTVRNEFSRFRREYGTGIVPTLQQLRKMGLR